jgi:hypothetical protein
MDLIYVLYSRVCGVPAYPKVQTDPFIEKAFYIFKYCPNIFGHTEVDL